MARLTKTLCIVCALTLAFPSVSANAQNTRARPKAVQAPPPSIDLFAYQNGAQFVQMPEGLELADVNNTPINFIDGALKTDLAIDAGPPRVFVLELSERTELRRIVFDSAFQGFSESAPRAVRVDVSDTSPTDGFTTVLSTNLRMAVDNQSFAMDPRALPVGRWVRLTLISNFGRERISLNGFRGYGRQLTTEAQMPNMSGTYDGASGIGTMSFTQTGDQVSGCYDYQKTKFTGIIKGRVLKLDLVETDISGDTTRLEGFYQLTPRGRLVGFMRAPDPTGDYAYPTYVSATRSSNRAGRC